MDPDTNNYARLQFTKIGFVCNPNARKGTMINKFNDEILPYIKRKLGDKFYNVLYTKHRGHGEDLAMTLVNDGCDAIISCGGDGTCNEVLNGILNSEKENVSMGILPIGSGNDFAKSVGLHHVRDSQDYFEMINTIDVGHASKIDVGVLKSSFVDRKIVGSDVSITTTHKEITRERYFLNEASFGISGGIMKSMNNKKSYLISENTSFMYETLMHQATYSTREISMEVDNNLYRYPQRLTIISNGVYAGAGLKFAPDAAIDDGLLNVCVLRNPSFMKTLQLRGKIQKGNHYGDKEVEHMTCTKFKASADEKTYVELDGELFGHLPIEVEILHQKLNFIILPELSYTSFFNKK